jgi:ABC-type bacteriocin/lantibiotic exporter with double-glycine peptidase domain
MQELKNKTRVLVTHAVDFLNLVDEIIVMKQGDIVL